ncbi:MAG: GAF domain-containing protein, partial [Sulfuricella sp.]
MADPIADSSLELNRHIVNLLDSLSAIHGLTEISIRDVSESQLLKLALEALMSNQDMERCSIFLLDEHGTLSNAAGLDWDDMLRDIVRPAEVAAARPPSKNSYRLGEGIMGRAAERGEIEHCRSCGEDPQFKKFSDGDKPIQGALLCVPVTCEGKVLGVLNVFYPTPDFFNLWHERLLLLFCKTLGRLLTSHRLMHNLTTLVDRRTKEIVDANASLRGEITQRQAFQEKLEKQHQFLQSIIDGISEPVMVINADYHVMLSNRASSPGGQQQFCYQMSHQRETPCDGGEHQCPLGAVLKEKRQIAVIHEHFDAQGEPHHIELMASPLFNEDGTIIGIIESARDITERLLAEKALRDLNETLDSRVKEEVARNMTNERLMIQQARLAAMGEMIGNIAHQWRQPLNALGLLLANIKDAYEYDELDKPYLDEAVSKGERLIQNMSSTIDDFRNFFKPNKVKCDFSLRKAINDTINLIGPGLRSHNISMIIEEGEDVLSNGFPNEFSQVLLNILTNAKDALLERKIAGGSIEIRLGCNDRQSFVAIKDNAGGIAEDISHKIFDPYFSTKEKGTGIGLYMSKMIL